MSTVAFLRQSTVVAGLVLALAGPAVAAGSTSSNTVEQLSEAASAALQKGDLKRAIEQFSAVIGTPGIAREAKAKAELNRGLAYQRQGLHAKAAEDYGDALALDALDARTRAIALYNRGLAYRKLNQPGLAIEDFTNALFLNATFAEAYMSRGLVMRESNKPYYALSDFHKAIENDFSRPQLAYFARALVFEELGRTDDAKNELNRALMAKPDFAEARQKLASLGGPAFGDASAEVRPASISSSGAETLGQQVASVDSAMITGSVGAAGQAGTGSNLPTAVTPPAHLLDDDAPRPAKVASIAPLASIKSRKPAAAQATATLLATSEATPAQPEPKRVKVATAETAAPVSDASPSPIASAPLASAEPKGWLIQLSSAQNEAGAWGVWKKLSAKHETVLKDQQAVVMRADLGAKGIFYRLRLAGFDSQKEAAKTCGSLKSRGLSCFVTKSD
ncbi:tetratricopeptide (TPR) repeat protein [Rhodoligotrophos appendicifer]|uniref:SPOR domain-containing protein n=1 Tax=Rhodoligotrophos appendicifer TaxID=987056 RepID=UPI001186EEDD|nr:SPOR domain-containing protein [Rhodoligotrophos appendicifer]